MNFLSKKNIPISEKEIEKNLTLFQKFLNIVKGKENIKNRINTLLNPDNILTSTNLTRRESEFLALSTFLGDNFDELKPLKEYAQLDSLAKLSVDGRGIKNVIAFESAISESKLLKNMNFNASTVTSKITDKRKGTKESE